MSKIINKGLTAGTGAPIFASGDHFRWASDQFREVSATTPTKDGLTATYLITGGSNEDDLGELPSLRSAVFVKDVDVDGVPLRKRTHSIRVKMPVVFTDNDGNVIARPGPDEVVVVVNQHEESPTAPDVVVLQAIYALLTKNTFDDESDKNLRLQAKIGLPGLVGIDTDYTGLTAS